MCWFQLFLFSPFHHFTYLSGVCLTKWVFPKIGVFTPNHPLTNRVFPYKPSILRVKSSIFGNTQMWDPLTNSFRFKSESLHFSGEI